MITNYSVVIIDQLNFNNGLFMKKIFKSFLLLFLALSYNVKANVYQQLTSGDLDQIKLASQVMVAGRENTKENADILAEILLSKYENALNFEIDMLSWVCKALGATNDGRYRKLLIKVYESDSHKKLRKYAKKSYQKLPGSTDEYIKGTINLASLQEKEEIRSSKIKPVLPKANLNRTERMLFSIAKGDLGSIKFMAKNIHRRPEVDSKISDALSEFLLVNYQEPADYQVDTLAWVCRALGELDNGRYTSVLEIVSEKSNHEKLRRYASVAYINLPKAKNSYIQGSVNFKEIIKKYKAI